MTLAIWIYEKPKYAIFDENTSSLSINIKGHLYKNIKEET